MNASRTLVVDASAALSVVLNESESDAVKGVIRERISRGVRVLVPELFWIEMSNTLVRRYHQPLDVVLEAIATLDRLILTTVQVDRAGVLAALAGMVDHRLSAYDATYLALAEMVDADLLTLDRDLRAAAGERAVRLDTGGVRESCPPYRLQPWITWDEAAGYLKAVHQVTLEETRR